MTGAIVIDPVRKGGPNHLRLLLAVAATVLVVGLVGPRVLFRTASSATETATFPEAAAATIAPTTTTSVAPTPAPPATSLPLGRNPFVPLGVVAVAASTPPPATPVIPTTVPVRQPTASARLRVLEVSFDASHRPQARMRVNDVAQTVTVGQTFGGRFTVDSLDIPARCGRFVAAGVRFTLCEGDERLV
jgi:hypothetical protein